jgi:uncharacterized protein YoxC
MPESWSLVIALLLAVLVGASLPVLFQLFLTLATVRRTMQQIGPRMTTLLGQIEQTAGSLNRATEGMDESAQRARKLLDSAGDLGDALHKLSRSLQPAVMLGTTVGPALAIAVKTLLDRLAEGQEDGEHGPDPHDRPPTETHPMDDVAKETEHA